MFRTRHHAYESEPFVQVLRSMQASGLASQYGSHSVQAEVFQVRAEKRARRP